MSTCPKNDIHSVYLDNELPEPYRQEYESHLKECPECQKKLDALRKQSSLFKQDKDSFHFTQNDLDQSFDRLQARMSYKKITGKVPEKRLSGLNSMWSYIAAGVAAAAVVAFIIPVKLSNRQETVSFQPVARTALSVPAVAQTDQAPITQASLNSLFGSQESTQPAHYASFTVNPVNEDDFYTFASYDIFSLIPSLAQDMYGPRSDSSTFTSIQSQQIPSRAEINGKDFLFNVDSAYNTYVNYLTGN